jgi:predicted  nucleic acid-binding Zn-ribbon protein
MEWVMCRACGTFVQAWERDGKLTPRRGDCPDCGGTEFKHDATETRVSGQQ